MNLTDACGESPSGFCEWVYDTTNSPRFAQFTDWFISRPARIVLIIVVALVANAIVRRAINRSVKRLIITDESSNSTFDRARSELLSERTERSRQRALTMGAVLRSVASTAILVFALLSILGEVGINLAPLVAGAGIAGVAIGFGAQSMVRDFLAGIFIVIEDQYGVGDWVDLGEQAAGEVERVSLRTTALRDLEGTLWVVPNGEIRRVANMSQTWSRAVVDVRVPNDADLSEAMAIIRTSAAGMAESLPQTIDAPEVLGVQSFTPGAVIVRVTVKTEPGAQWAAARAMRVALKQDLDDAGIRATPAVLSMAPESD